jgi:photosystem II stability/assembly factor-like uncharacterized protein
MKWRIALVIAAVIATLGPASSQTPADLLTRLRSLPPEAQSNALRRFQYFYEQRAYPNQQIPPGAMQKARQDLAKQVSPATQPAFDQNLWTPIGPSQISTNPTTSGRINTIAVDPTNTNIIYIGAATGGVWKSMDGGNTWTPLTDTQCSVAMGSIAIDPSNPLVVYAGTGEENFSPDSYYGCGVLKSTDGGNTWTQIGASVFAPAGAAGAGIGKIVIHPTVTGTLHVASNFGLYRSTDGGSTFNQVLGSSSNSRPATDVVIDPVTPSTMYAALGYPGGGASFNGVYKSTDTGATWTQLAGGLPTSNVGRISLAVAASASGTVYASVQNAPQESSPLFGKLLGIWKTTNFGTSWTLLSAPAVSCSNQCFYDMYVAVDPFNANTIYFGGFSVYKSTDGGSTFSDIGSAIHEDQHALMFQPNNTNTIYVGNDGGVFMSTDGGSTWKSLNTNLAITQFYPGLALHPSNSSIAMGGTQDNGVNWTTGSTVWNQLLDGDGGFTAFDLTTPTTGYAEAQWITNSQFSGPRLSTNVGVSGFNLITNGINLGDNALFVPPLVMSRSSSQTLYFGTNKVYKTTNQGTNWQASGTTIVSEITNRGVTAIAEAPSNANVIYAGSYDGIYKSTDGNATYASISTGLPNRVPTSLSVHPTDANTAFATFSSFGTGHVFKTTDGGTSWANISGNLPNIPTNSIVLDPSAPTMEIMVGTDLGVYRTHDGGMTWIPFNNGLPNVPVVDLKYNATAGLVVAATHGRGVWKTSAGSVQPSAPTVTAIRPTTGTTLGGTPVTITGTNFTGATAVKFGSASAIPFTVNSATSITTTSPAGSGVVDVTVTTLGATSPTSAADRFTYTNPAPVITLNPSNATVAVGQTATFIAAATGTPIPTVQWQQSTNGTTFTNIFRATSPTYSFTVTSSENGHRYRAVFTNSAGHATTTAAILSVPRNSAPVITLNPSNSTVAVGQTATFIAAATGTPIPTVQWQQSTNGTTFTNIFRATSPTYSFTVTSSENGHRYRAVFTNSAGHATTTAATLTVSGAGAAFTVHYRPAPRPKGAIGGTQLFDGWLPSVFYGQQFQSDDKLMIGGWANSSRVYMQWDLEGLPQNVTSAVLSLYATPRNDGSTLTGFDIRRPDPSKQHASWVNIDANKKMTTELISETQPVGLLPVGSFEPGINNNYWDMDITSVFNLWQAGMENNGLTFIPWNTNDNFVQWSSSRNSIRTQRPLLSLTFTAPGGMPDFKIPLPAGYSWMVSREVGGFECMSANPTPDLEHQNENYFTVDFGSDNLKPGGGSWTGPVPILASAKGTVLKVGNAMSTGNYIILDHGNGYLTRYMHLNHPAARKTMSFLQPGDQVNQGDQIGLMGRFGSAAETHVHMNFWFNTPFNGRSDVPNLTYVIMDGFLLKGFQTECSIDVNGNPIARNEYYLSTNYPTGK